MKQDTKLIQKIIRQIDIRLSMYTTLEDLKESLKGYLDYLRKFADPV